VSKQYIETIKALDGELFHLEYHQKRLNSVLQEISPYSAYSLKDLLSPPSSSLYRCRFLYSSDSFEIEYIKYKKRSIKSLKLVYDDVIEYSKKSAERENINQLYLQKENCDEILIVKNSLITDTSIANITLYDGSTWLTPKAPLLKGTTRERLLEHGKIFTVDIGVRDLVNFEKLALMNAMVDFDIIAEENIGEIIC